MWAGFESYIASFRDIIGLDLPEFKKWQAWEDAARHGGPRMMHDRFCIVSDFPEFIHVDSENMPHCADGPSHRWRDGWALYHWHGVSIPGEWVTGKPPTPADAITWGNVEQRRAAIEILGWENVLPALKAKVVAEDPDPQIGAVVEVELPDIEAGPSRAWALRAQCGTGRTIFEFLDRKAVEALAEGGKHPLPICAQAWRVHKTPAEFSAPLLRT